MVAQGYNYDPSTGIYTYKPVNVNGNWYSGIYVSFNRSIDKQKFWSWSTNTSMNYNRYVDLTSQSGETSSTKNTTGSYYTSETLKLTYQKNDLSIGLNGRLTWRRSLVSNKNANDVNVGQTALVFKVGDGAYASYEHTCSNLGGEVGGQSVVYFHSYAVVAFVYGTDHFFPSFGSEHHVLAFVLTDAYDNLIRKFERSSDN